MSSNKPISIVRGYLAVSLLLALVWGSTVAAISQSGASGRVSSDHLGGKSRSLGHVSTDKPIYRIGEKVYVRSVLLDAADHKPSTERTRAWMQIKGPKGDIITSARSDVQDSVTGFFWQIPDGQAGGEYTISVSYPQLGIPPATRKFDIRAFRAPRLRSQIIFVRDGYGPGDEVGATLEVKRAEGGIPENAKVTILARVDGQEVHKSQAVVNRAGTCTARFSLPKSIERGEGTLAFVIEDGGVVETASKSIPILLQTVDLSIYPESGDLVAGLACRVYVEAKAPAQKPADLAGIILDAKNRQVGTFRTEHEGRGRFVFVPEKGGEYRLKITQPSGIHTTYPLPAAKDIGTLIQATEDVYEKGKAIVLRVLSTEKGPLTLTLSKREVELSSLEIEGSDTAGEETIADVMLTPPASADGVLVAAVWDAEGRPLAERLIYRKPAASIQIAVQPDKPKYIPGENVTLRVKTTDQNGAPIGAVVGLTVTDDSVLEMIEKREQAPSLPVMVLLENDVRELADAHVYLDPKNPKAPLATDLLLGTQGWRRFAFIDAAEFLDKHGDEARRILAMRVVPIRDAGRSADEKGGFNFGREDQWNEKNALAAAKLDGGVHPPGEPAVKHAQEAQNDKRHDKDEGLQAKPEDDEAVDREIAEEPIPNPGPRPAVMEERLEKMAKSMAHIDDRKRQNAREGRYASIRVYAHATRPNRTPNDRVDFTETLYWTAGVKTDPKTGEATMSFGLNDSVTSFRVLSDAFSQAGALGADSMTLESVQPFYAEPKLPLEVTMGDRILLPIGVINGTSDRLQDALVKIGAIEGIDIAASAPFSLAGGERARRIVELTVGDIVGTMDFVLDASAGPYNDRVTRKLRVVPRGFPVEINHGGMLKPDASLTLELRIPKGLIRGSVSSDIAVYPTPLANLTKALERLIREPCGCFEQTTSSTYPLVMAQQYFLSHQGVDPKLIERSRGLLEKGYKRLSGFECKSHGYEWFGADPGHEALTAFGLLEFVDMARVHSVDPAMLKRTREWLLGTRDGKGGFQRKRRALHTWNTDKDCSNAYITWALLEGGEKAEALKQEIDIVKQAAATSKNSYVIALGANIASIAGDTKTAKSLMDKLVGLQDKDGRVTGGLTTIVASGGIALNVETTSLTTLAWLRDPAYAGSVEKAIKWLADSCQSGRYGSTQSTVLALRAIITYDTARAKPKADGSIQLFIDGHKAGSEVTFDKDTHGAIQLTDIAEMLEPGEHVVEIRMKGGSEMPFALAINYSTETPNSSKDCDVGLDVRLADETVAEGAVTEANVTVINRADKAIPTPIAIIGIPGGLEVRHDQLKELVKAGRISAYEVLGRNVVLYWRMLDAGQKVKLPISLVAAIPGTYTGPASRAYLYYTDEYKHWTDPMQVTVTPK